MIAWVEAPENVKRVGEAKDGNGNEGSLRRGDVAVDVMTIVGSVL